MTGEEIENHIKQLGYEPRHDVYALAEAINLTSEDLKSLRDCVDGLYRGIITE